MSLATLIRTGPTPKPANANPANSANGNQGEGQPLAGLAALALATPATASPELFVFSPPGDPTNDDEALQERVALMMEGNGWTEERALQEARWHADRGRCWRTFQINARRVLEAPRYQQRQLLARFQSEASDRYGAASGAIMAEELRNWVTARRVH